MVDKYGKILLGLRNHYTGVSMLGSFTDKTPFQILIATALSARSKDKTTIEVIADLFPKYPTAEDMAVAPINDLERLVRKTGFYRIKAKRIQDISKVIITKYSGKVPNTMHGLLSLPGVGRKTASCVLVYAFGKDAIPVDIHVHRISNRLGWCNTNKPEETEDFLLNNIPKKHWQVLNEVLVIHGQNLCAPISPHCSRCPIENQCPRINVKKER